MAVATRKRTQTNFDVKAVWQYFNMEDVMCEALDIGNVPCAFVALDDGTWSVCARSEGAVGALTRCFSASRASAAASSSCSTCKTIPNNSLVMTPTPLYSGWVHYILLGVRRHSCTYLLT